MADEGAGCLNNWEEQGDRGILDRRLEEISQDCQSEQVRNKQAAEYTAVPNGLLLPEDIERTQCKPPVRILRRETKSPCSISARHTKDSGIISSPKSSKHSKSLQQREAEYAEARLRIFGLSPPEDDDGGNINDEIDDDTRKIDANSIQSQISPRIFKPGSSSPKVTLKRQQEESNSITKLDSS